jgi:hypothetical protein
MESAYCAMSDLCLLISSGYFSFQECGSETNPTIGIEIGETYTFLQQDKHNYMHPLGFAYFPDGAHDDKAELEPGVVPGGATSGGCADTLTCPAPMYFMDDEYVGVYSNNPNVKNVTTNEGDFGLDNYEPLFFRNLVDWTDFGTFKVMLRFDQDYDQDLFYFCHVSYRLVLSTQILRRTPKIGVHF